MLSFLLQLLSICHCDVNRDAVKGLRVLYTNIDKVIQRRLELQDYIEERRPKIVCLTETTLNKDINTVLDNNCNIWRRSNRRNKSGGRVLRMRQKLLVNEMEYGEWKAEIVSVNSEN